MTDVPTGLPALQPLEAMLGEWARIVRENEFLAHPGITIDPQTVAGCLKDVREVLPALRAVLAQQEYEKTGLRRLQQQSGEKYVSVSLQLTAASDRIDNLTEKIEELEAQLAQQETEQARLLQLHQNTLNEVDRQRLRADANFTAANQAETAKRLLEAAERRASRAEAQRLTPAKVADLRAQCHGTYNGGWHDNPAALRAFHHGMDTVCNVLEANVVAADPAPTEERTA